MVLIGFSDGQGIKISGSRISASIDDKGMSRNRSYGNEKFAHIFWQRDASERLCLVPPKQTGRAIAVAKILVQTIVRVSYAGCERHCDDSGCRTHKMPSKGTMR